MPIHYLRRAMMRFVGARMTFPFGFAVVRPVVNTPANIVVAAVGDIDIEMPPVPMGSIRIQALRRRAPVADCAIVVVAAVVGPPAGQVPVVVRPLVPVMTVDVAGPVRMPAEPQVEVQTGENVAVDNPRMIPVPRADVVVAVSVFVRIDDYGVCGPLFNDDRDFISIGGQLDVFDIECLAGAGSHMQFQNAIGDAAVDRQVDHVLTAISRQQISIALKANVVGWHTALRVAGGGILVLDFLIADKHEPAIWSFPIWSKFW